MQFLNTNYSLYNAVIKAEVEGNLTTEEAQRAAQTLRIDFEKGGIHLCAGGHSILGSLLHSFHLVFLVNLTCALSATEKLERVNQLNIEIALLGRQYVSSIHHLNLPVHFSAIVPCLFFSAIALAH